MCKHSVLIISYNQEKYIANAIESLLIQKEFLYEIIISDDCSKDKTWDIILKYYLQYPFLIKPFKQDKNVGIFKNLEHGLSKLSGEIVTLLAGDDILNNGIFKEMNRLINENSINLEKDYFNIIFNHEIIYPNGTKILIDNFKNRKIDAFKLKLRYLINNRDIGISINIIKKIPPLPENLGINSDGIFDDYIFYFSKINIYTSFIGEKYYAQLGISSTTNYISSIESMIKVLIYIKNAYHDKLDNEDISFLKFEIKYWNLFLKFSIINWFQLFFLVILNNKYFITKENYFNYILKTIKMPIKIIKLKKKKK